MSASFEARRALPDLASDKHHKCFALLVAVTYVLLLASIAMLFYSASVLGEAYSIRERAAGTQREALSVLLEAQENLETAKKIVDAAKGRCGRAA